MYYMYLEFSSGMKEMLPEPLGILELEQMGSVRKEEGNECLLVGGLVRVCGGGRKKLVPEGMVKKNLAKGVHSVDSVEGNQAVV